MSNIKLEDNHPWMVQKNKAGNINSLIRMLKESVSLEPSGYDVIIEDTDCLSAESNSTTVRVPQAEIMFNFCNDTGRLRYISNYQ